MSDQKKADLISLHGYANKDEVIQCVENSKCCVVVSLNKENEFQFRQWEEPDVTLMEFWSVIGYLYAILNDMSLGIKHE